MQAVTYVWRCPGGIACLPWYLVITDTEPPEGFELNFHPYDSDGNSKTLEHVGIFSHSLKKPSKGFYYTKKELMEGLTELGLGSGDLKLIETRI